MNEIANNQELKLLLIFLSVALVVQLFYYLFFYLRVFSKKLENPSNQRFGKVPEPISVIISARDEEQNLRNNLEAVLTQKYPYFQVVVVNDASEDDSGTVLAQFKQKYPHLHIVTIHKDKKFSHNKKLALTVGIKGAKHNWLVFTDADCKPDSNLWLSSLQQNFNDSTDIILGYGGYQYHKGLLNFFIRFETMFIGLQYFTFQIAGIPYMGVGRNLAYKKDFFWKRLGFKSHAHITTGDDDLFVNQNATKQNTRSVLHPNSITRSVPDTSWNRWFQQKTRHYGAAPYYKPFHKLMLTLEPASRILFYALLGFILIYNIQTWDIVLSAFLFRFFIQNIVFYKTAKILGEKNLWFIGFLLDIFLPLINFIIYLIMKVKQQRIKKI